MNYKIVKKYYLLDKLYINDGKQIRKAGINLVRHLCSVKNTCFGFDFFDGKMIVRI